MNTLFRFRTCCLSALLLLSGLGLQWAAHAEIPPTNPTPVTTHLFEQLAFHPTYSAPGTAISINNARISAEIDGVVVALPLRTGDRVQAGGLVAILDCRDHALALAQTDAMLDAARAENQFARYRVNRARQLVRSQSVSAEVLNEREAQANQSSAETRRLEAAVRAAQRRVEKCDIRAPFDAVVAERIVSLGELVGPGTALMRLLDVEQVEVHGTVQEQDMPGLQAASDIRFLTARHSHPLRVRAMIPEVEIRTRSYPVRLTFIDGKPAPGQVGRIEWSSPRRHLPANLLVSRDGALGVFIVEDGHAVFHAIDAAVEGQPAAVNLPPDTRIVIDGRFGLRHGDPVVVSP